MALMLYARNTKTIYQLNAYNSTYFAQQYVTENSFWINKKNGKK